MAENEQELGSIQSILIPTNTILLLVPSTVIAEVASIAELTPVASTMDCVLGIFGWRGMRVPVISFEKLSGQVKIPPGPHSKIVIFYPLGERHKQDFFGILSSTDPQSLLVERDQIHTDGIDGIDSPYIAEVFKLNETVVGIPDLKAIRNAFDISQD